MLGGRRAAESALAQIDPVTYARDRNFLDGAVTRLSAYLRHGVLTLAEVRDAALARVSRAEDAEKFVSELGWRDYWQRVYAALGDGVWKDREELKTGWRADDYAAEMPSAVTDGESGLACMDGFAKELRDTGYLHNHARMWVAAWVVHWLRVRWQEGARWFLRELVDGDVASNNLSWQWVASTFAAKPYIFNRENLERYTAGRYCEGCAMRAKCPFDASYEELEARLFPRLRDVEAVLPQKSAPVPKSVERKPERVGAKPLVWVHEGALRPQAEVFSQWPAAAAVFVWDEAWLRQEQPSGNRLGFVEECLREMPAAMVVRRGEVAGELLAEAAATGADCVVAMRSVEPRHTRVAEALASKLPVVWVDGPEFVRADGVDLKRFSRYWSRVKLQALRPTKS